MPPTFRANKILAVNEDETMMSPISFTGLAVRYKMNEWSEPKNSTRYLFVYKTLEDAQKLFSMFAEVEQKQLIIVECLVENFELAVGAGPVDEYRCTRVKPIRVIE